MPIPVPVVQTGLEKSIDLAAKKAGKNLRINMGPGARSIESLAKPLGRLTGKADEFTKSMEAANARVLAFGASVGVITAVSKSMQELVRTTVEVEKSLANINSILNQTQSQLNNFKNTIFDIARNTGQGFDTVAEAALELSRQGLKAEEVTKRLNDALVLSRLSGLSAADSVAGLTAAINSFKSAGLTSEQVLNKISAAAASAAVSDRDLIEGLKRSGSVAVTTGVQFDELIGIISSLQEKTARGGAVIGNSLKTIFTRVQDLDKLETLQNLGVQITDFNGQVLSSSKIIENLAPAFAKLDQASKVSLADNLVGKFQIAPFLALLEQYNEKIVRSSEISNKSLNATDEAYKRNAILNQTLATAVNTAVVNLKELGNALGEIGVTDNLKLIIATFNDVVSGIRKILDGDSMGSKFAKGLVKGIGNVLAGPGLALALVAIGKLLLDFAKFGAGALKTFFGLNKAAQAQAALQGQIAASLLNDKTIRKEILNIENQAISVEEKRRLQAQYFTKALNEQLLLMKQMQGISMTITPAVMRGTAAARGGRAAGGYLPIGAERSDISKGVGGAPSSAKPVVIPNFAFGGGRRGTMVANTSEYIVPNYANGGDAIFNQNMASSMGLPANARKVRAASGFIPNFASTTVQDIIAKPSNFIKADGTFKSGVGANLYASATLSQKATIDEYRNRNRYLYTYYANESPATVMLVPKEKALDANAADHRFLGAGYRGIQKLPAGKGVTFFEGGVAGINPALKGSKGKSGKGKKLARLLNLDGLIRDELAAGVNRVFQYFDDGSGDLFKLNPEIVTGENVESIMEKGGPGAFGAIKGATFEALIKAVTGGIAQDKGELDVQFNKSRELLELIFGVRGYDYGDLKNSIGQKEKFARQTLDNVVGKVVLNRKIKTANEKNMGSPNAPNKSAASGYIPNFAASALEDAIGREQAAGVPINQIRVNQSGKLRNSKNPQGLAVTNTRDEPTGRIPNYAITLPANDTTKAIAKAAGAGKSFGDAGMKAMMLASGLGLLRGVIDQTASSQEEANKATFRFVDALDLAMQMIMTHAMMSMIPTGGHTMASSLKAIPGVGKVGGAISSGVGKAGSMISNLVGKLGIFGKGIGLLAKPFKFLGGILPKVGGFFARFVPFIGPFIMGFQAISFMMKKWGVDFKGMGDMTLNALKKLSNAIVSMATGIPRLIINAFKMISEKVPFLSGLTDSLENADNFLANVGRFETDTFSESLNKAQKSTAAKKVQEQKPEEETPEQIAAEEKKKLLADQEKSIRLSTAKLQISSAIELQKLELTRKGAFEQQLETAKKLGNVSFDRMQYLERMTESEKFSAETNGLLLDKLKAQVEAVTGLTVNTDKFAQASKSVAKAMKDGKFEADELYAIANEMIGATQQNEKINTANASNLKTQVEELLKQRGVLKDINDEELRKTQLLDKQLKLRQINRQLEKSDLDIYEESLKFGLTKGLGGIDAEITRLQNSKRGKSATAQAAIDVDIARQQVQKTALQQEERLTVSRNRLNLLGFSLQAGDLTEDERRDKKLEYELLKKQLPTLELEAKIAKDRADADLKLAEAGRVLETSLVKLANGFDDFALAQKAEDLKFQGATAVTNAAKFENEFQQRALRKAQAASTVEERAKIIAEEPFRRSYEDRLKVLSKSDLEINSDFTDNLIKASEQFKKNFVSAFAEGIQSVDTLKKSLLNAANQFLQAMTKSFVQKWMDGASNDTSGGGLFKKFISSFSTGGKVSGGSGSRDDVPAMLMGGEYVINKKAVSKYGMGFFEALNSGSLKGFARGGQVRDREGMFSTPGMNGAGPIVGGRNLMAFATQSPFALTRDTFTGNGAFLDAESGRMTMFGRRNNPQFQRVQDAKRSAFDLAVREQQAKAQAREQRVSLGSMLASAAISTVVGYGIGKTVGGDVGKLLGSGIGNLAGTAITGAPSYGGALGAAATDPEMMTKIQKMFSNLPVIGEYTGKIFSATGGLITSAGGTDTVPAMLSGGEFVMNAAATRNIGAGNLQALNSGAATGDNSDLVAKLDELIRTTETSKSTGEINITINGSNGTETQTAGQETTEQQRALSERIKVAVKQVIADEKRLGGQLRR